MLSGFSYNGAKYYYIRNLQNDIIGILDNSGVQVVFYTYDSWGKLIRIEGTEKDTIGVLNPFRYRGYYYDTESGFYYLNSRYYDPMVGRFLNADGLIDSRGHVTQNLFQYCGNNFVNYIDSSGKFAIEIASGIFLGGMLLAMYVAQYAPELAQLVTNVIVGLAEATDSLVESISQALSQSDAQTKVENNQKQPAVFTFNPYDFNLNGLERIVRPGTKNGQIIQWVIPDTKIVIFEWDEDWKNNPHYHALLPGWENAHNGPHYNPGTPVPEPWNSTFFG